MALGYDGPWVDGFDMIRNGNGTIPPLKNASSNMWKDADGHPFPRFLRETVSPPLLLSEFKPLPLRMSVGQRFIGTGTDLSALDTHLQYQAP